MNKNRHLYNINKLLKNKPRYEIIYEELGKIITTQNIINRIRNTYNINKIRHATPLKPATTVKQNLFINH